MKILLKNKLIDINKNINLEDYKTDLNNSKSLVNLESLQEFIKSYTMVRSKNPISVNIGGLKNREKIEDTNIKKIIDRIFYKEK